MARNMQFDLVVTLRCKLSLRPDQKTLKFKSITQTENVLKSSKLWIENVGCLG